MSVLPSPGNRARDQDRLWEVELRLDLDRAVEAEKRLVAGLVARRGLGDSELLRAP